LTGVSDFGFVGWIVVAASTDAISDSDAVALAQGQLVGFVDILL
jgi:hypothetical protein